MQRMRHYVVFAGLLVASTTLFAGRASAGLMRPAAERSYPDIAADINGTVDYTYNPSTQSGLFRVVNTPYLIAGGEDAISEYSVNPDTNGVRRQTLTVATDSTGRFRDDPANSYELWGEIKVKAPTNFASGLQTQAAADELTFTGLLLRGTPTSFGSQDLGAVGIEGSDVFDLDLNITGGVLADFFGETAYMRITPELQSTFDGSFTRNFGGVKATSNTRTYNAPHPFPIPEPSTILILLAGGGLLHRLRRRKR